MRRARAVQAWWASDWLRPVSRARQVAWPRTQVLAVGDSLRTDIAGAAGVDIDSCWVLGGIHRAELNGDPVAATDAARHAGLAPTAAVPTFTW